MKRGFKKLIDEEIIETPETPKSSKRVMQIDGVVFEGGGVLGTAYAGVARALFESKHNPEYYCGSSAGSIAALILCLTQDIKLIEEIMFSADYAKFRDNCNIITGLWRVYKKNGYYSKDVLTKWLHKVVYKICGTDDITFDDLYKKKGKTLIITTYSLEFEKTIYMSRFTSPYLSVVDACVRSSTIPLFFESSNQFLDGGLLDNYPIKKLREICGNNICGFKFDRTRRKNPVRKNENALELSLFLFDLLIENAFKIHLSEEDHAVSVNIPIKGYSSIDFDLTRADKKELARLGYESAVKYLSK